MGRGKAAASGALLLAVCALVAGCGEGAKQNADEPHANYPIEVTAASFPVKQYVSRHEHLVITLRNAGHETAPNVAVTIQSFTYQSSFPNLADRRRPVWVVEKGPGPGAHPPVNTQEVSEPGGAQTAYVSTWTLGPLSPGQVRTYRWNVVPVKPGRWNVTYRVAGGLAGNAKAVAPGGGAVEGLLRTLIGGEPPPTYVDPKTGEVVEGEYH
ncbi:MAG TPA: hypothetical protein VMA83_09060 [Solirubrobacteraceae bacterium]|nr:hypothetical protein [Solirubrobacteraceae bacterium]